SLRLQSQPSSTVSYTLSLHDALPISAAFLWAVFSIQISNISKGIRAVENLESVEFKNYINGKWVGTDHGIYQNINPADNDDIVGDRKSTRLNSSHVSISYAVFCLKKV